jgi:hypothetical protein
MKENDEPTFTYSLGPESISVTDIEKSMSEPPNFRAHIHYLQYGGDDYELHGDCHVEYTYCDGVLEVKESHGKSLNDAALKIIAERLRELGETTLTSGEMCPGGCNDYMCPKHGCPPETFLTRKQVAERNLRDGPLFGASDEEWEREAAGYRATIAEDDAKNEA